MTGKLTGKIAVITGGNSGIGLATARRFVAEGAKVALLGRDATRFDAAVSELGTDAIGTTGDVQNAQDLDRLFKEVKDTYGSIDVLFVNAGLANIRPIEDVDGEHFDLIFGVNVKGAYFTVQKALPLMNDGGAIVLNTSIANQTGNAGMSVYSASKAALRSLARTLSSELVGRGIRVNAVSPGPIETPFTRDSACRRKHRQKWRRRSSSGCRSSALVRQRRWRTPFCSWRAPSPHTCSVTNWSSTVA